MERYIIGDLVHLKDSRTYEIVEEGQALAEAEELRSAIFAWTVDRLRECPSLPLTTLEKSFDDTQSDPFGFFIFLYKLHENPMKTRPVCSDCVSLPNAALGLGEWVDAILLQSMVVKAQHTYFLRFICLENRI